MKLNTICTKIVDGNHNPPAGLSKTTNFKMLSAQNINNDQIVDLDKVRYLPQEVFEQENKRTKLRSGDILLTTVGTLGRSCIVSIDSEFVFQRSVTVLTTSIYNKFLKYWLDSPYIQFYMVKHATGTAQKGFYLNQVSELVVPVPSLEEQNRIVAKLEQILPLIADLS